MHAKSIAPTTDWLEIDQAIVRLAVQKGARDHEEGRWLLAARRVAIHLRFGYASFAEYVSRRLGYDARTVAARLRVAEALVDLPELAEALRTGALHFTAVRELVRVVVRATETEWLEAARSKTVRDIERMISGLVPGDRPGEPKDPALRKHVLRFELGGAAFALIRDAIDRAKREIDPALSDEEALRAIAAAFLGEGNDDAGRAPYQVSLMQCTDCNRSWQRTRGEAIAVEAEVGEAALCDAEITRVAAPTATHVGETAATQMGQIAATQMGQIAATQMGQIAAAHTGQPQEASEARSGRRPAGGFTSPLTCAASEARSGRNRRSSGRESEDPRRPASDFTAPPTGTDRPRRSVTPKLRRQILARDGGRCSVSGCTHTRFLEVHHLKPRAEGGCHQASNLLTLCSVHHALWHQGRLRIEGTPETRLVFLHADGTPYGSGPRPSDGTALEDARLGLIALGFVRAAIRPLLAEAEREIGDRSSGPELLRAALRISGRGRASVRAPTAGPGEEVRDAPCAGLRGYARRYRELTRGWRLAG